MSRDGDKARELADAIARERIDRIGKAIDELHSSENFVLVTIRRSLKEELEDEDESVFEHSTKIQFLDWSELPYFAGLLNKVIRMMFGPVDE